MSMMNQPDHGGDNSDEIDLRGSATPKKFSNIDKKFANIEEQKPSF